jgi:hypothetical protein
MINEVFQAVKHVSSSSLVASVALLLGSIVPAAASDVLPNPRPSGCFVAVARDWNERKPDDVPSFAAYADRFERCADRDRDEVQIRSDLVGWYKSELGLTAGFLQIDQRAIAKRHYDRCYAVLNRMASLSTRSGDVALARYVTENSEHLMHAEGLFAQEARAVGDIPGGVR